MIELIVAERCVGCNACVTICPTNVFDPGADHPVIARQDDCQTCFMCELYCPEDALYVAPEADRASQVHEHDAQVQQLLGSYRSAIGWGKNRQSTAALDHSFELLARAH